jgi:NAD(P)H-hydrate repair Nnr-like enzyme with NAD(P)H-hydrate epimerase domain
LPDNSPGCYQTLQDAGVQVVAIDFPSNLHTNDLLLSIWYAESAAAFDPSQDRKDSK